MSIQNVNDLINAVYLENEEKYGDAVLNVLKKNHLFPSLKVKKFKDNSNLVLIHNTYKRNDTKEYQELYDQCRSIILDFSKSVNNNIVVTYANSIPVRSDIQTYINTHYDANDKCYMALDGTMITVYNYNGVWHFGTTSCANINSSKFSHPTKTHGAMLDEVLYEIYNNMVDINDPNISQTLRNLFTINLDPLISYEFVLIHYENKHIVSYENELGLNYKFLFHINSKNRITLQELAINEQPLLNLGIKYSIYFNTPEEAINYLNTDTNCYGIIIKKPNLIYKITKDEILKREEVDSCNPNIWYNFLYVYMLNKKNYKIINYINDYAPQFTSIVNPDEFITSAMNILNNLLYNLYIGTTKYYPKYGRFKADMDVDRKLNSLIRFHLAQLRHQQITLYKESILKKEDINNYLCHSNNIKNIKNLINYFGNNGVLLFNLPPEDANILNTLYNFLKNYPSV